MPLLLKFIFNSQQGRIYLAIKRPRGAFLVVQWFVQFSSVALSCLTLCDPMDCSTPCFPVHCQLPEFTQTHVHWVSDAIPPTHPLSSPSRPTFNLSQNQGLFKWVSSLHQVAKVLEFQLQHQFFQWTPRTDLYDGLAGSSCSPRDSWESSPKPKFKSINSLALSFLHSPTLTSIHDSRKTIALTRQTFVGKVISLLFNILSRLVITFLPRSKRLLISWLKSPSTVISEPKKIVCRCFHFPPSIHHQYRCSQSLWSPKGHCSNLNIRVDVCIKFFQTVKIFI